MRFLPTNDQVHAQQLLHNGPNILSQGYTLLHTTSQNLEECQRALYP